MNKVIISCAIWLLTSGSALAQTPTVADLKPDTIKVTTGYSMNLHSKILNQDRTIMVSVPEGYATSYKKYPVVYILDAQWNFNHASQNLAWLASKDCDFIPQSIVVGICSGGEKREHDLTPTQGSGNGGGADSLYMFIKKEVMPFIEQNYRTYNYRILGGVSYGGLFVMNAFVKDPLYFNGYIAMSPSMWWDNQIALKNTEELLSKNTGLPTRLYITLANEGESMGVDSLAALLKKYSPKQLAWKYDKHLDEVHNTINYKSLWDGAKFVFSKWSYPLVDFATEENPFTVPSKNGTVSNPKIKKASSADLINYSGLYKDSYGRLISIEKSSNYLMISYNNLSSMNLYPESRNRFFIKKETADNDLHLKNALIEFEFSAKDSLTMYANGITYFSAKKVIPSPLISLSEKSMSEYIGNYVASLASYNFQISKVNNSLMISTGGNTAKLYPIATNKFFLQITGLDLEATFSKDDSGKISKVYISRNGEMLMTANKSE